jgi:hypothetical protein
MQTEIAYTYYIAHIYMHDQKTENKQQDESILKQTGATAEAHVEWYFDHYQSFLLQLLLSAARIPPLCVWQL